MKTKRFQCSMKFRSPSNLTLVFISKVHIDHILAQLGVGEMIKTCDRPETELY